MLLILEKTGILAVTVSQLSLSFNEYLLMGWATLTRSIQLVSFRHISFWLRGVPVLEEFLCVCCIG